MAPGNIGTLSANSRSEVREPHWIARNVADAIHQDQIKRHGGRAGVRDENAIESALARPRNKFSYSSRANVWELAAAYGYGLARNHGYTDGNKRVAFAVMYTFLGINGWHLRASEPEVVVLITELAAGEITEPALARWLKAHGVRDKQ